MYVEEHFGTPNVTSCSQSYLPRTREKQQSWGLGVIGGGQRRQDRPQRTGTGHQPEVQQPASDACDRIKAYSSQFSCAYIYLLNFPSAPHHPRARGEGPPGSCDASPLRDASACAATLGALEGSALWCGGSRSGAAGSSHRHERRRNRAGSGALAPGAAKMVVYVGSLRQRCGRRLECMEWMAAAYLPEGAEFSRWAASPEESGVQDRFGEAVRVRGSL